MAWALTHDISTWPLSHTGEAAFGSALNIDARQLRACMILGDTIVPAELRLDNILREVSLDGSKLLALFERESGCIGGDFLILHRLLHSPITPDSLEGIYRAAISIGMNAPKPTQVADAILPDLFSSAVVRGKGTKEVVAFWRAKGRLYEHYINSARAIRFESRWSDALKQIARVDDMGLRETLSIDEDDLVSRVERAGLSPYKGVNRYKPPLSYRVGHRIKSNKSYPVEHLSDVLTKQKLHGL